MHTITLKQKLTEEETKSLEGEYIDESYIDHLLQKDTIVTNEEGKTICVLIKNCIPSNIAESAYYSLRKAIATTNNRGIASGKLPTDLKVGDSFQGDIVGRIDNEYRYVPLKKDGTLSNSPKAKMVNSSIIGYADRYARIPYCRTTAFTYSHFNTYKKAVPYIQYISRLFKEYLPDRWQNQKNEWDKTTKDFKIQDTVFTTVTVNKNFRTACHYDKGDLPEGFGNLAVLETGKYDGGYTVIPKYGVAVDVRNCVLALFDVHEFLGNSELDSVRPFERISVVCYFRKKMTECGSALEELEIAKQRS